MSELPQGWALAPLATLAEARMGETILAKHLTPTGAPVYSAGQENNPWGFLENPRKLLRKGTVVVSARGSIGFPKIPKEELFASTQTTIALRFPSEEAAKYGCLWLKTVDWGALTKGGAIPMLTVGDINELMVPVAPIGEQHRLVAKLERLLSRVDAAQARLGAILQILKRFRQSVLSVACAGRLTADWRTDNPSVESALELLQRIRAARLERASNDKERAQIQAAFSNGIRCDDENVELPSTWVFCSIGAAGSISNGSTPSRKVPEYWGGNIHWVSSGEVRNNIISATRESITEQGFKNSFVRLLPRGTVLLAMIGEGKTRGQSAILNIEATTNQNIAAVDIRHGGLEPAYLWLWFQHQYETTREHGSGSGPQALNCERVRELPFHLPPVAEQKEIVRRVEALFKTADALEARYRKAKAHVDKLTQSILAKAFRGELVPQDPNDEPASVLLDRIRKQNHHGRLKKTKRHSVAAGRVPAG